MNTATELYKAGRLAEAIEAQIQEVKGHPADPSRRLFLFELLLFSGDLDRARRQVDALKFDDPGKALAILDYRLILDAEAARRRVWADGEAPQFIGGISEPMRLRLEAVERLRAGHPAEAAGLLAEAAEATPPCQGLLNKQPFRHLRDTDDLFAGMLEVLVQGRYYWVGFDQVAFLTMNPPSVLRDLIYFPARLAVGEVNGEAFLPSLYPNSYAHPDDAVKLGRLTDWTYHDGPLALGVGQHHYLRDDGEISLLEWRELQIVLDEGAEAPRPEAEADR